MSLQVWLPLNGNLNNQGLSDYQISVFRGTETYNNSGKIGKCFYANGTNTLKILNIIPDIYNYNSYSLCCWFYIEAQNTSHSGSGIISGGNWNNQLLNLSISDWSTDHYTKLRISGTNWNRTYSYNFALNTWYHAVVCDDGVKTYAYINGNLIGDSASSFLPTSIEGNDICIGGATYYSGMQFFGRINDVRIYDHCLSAKEVEEISKGLVLHYKLDNNGLGGNNLATNTTFPANTIQGYNGYKAVEYNHSDWTSGGRFFAGYSNSRLSFTEIVANQPYTISAWVYIYDDVILSNPGGTSIFYRVYKTGDSPTYGYDIAVTLSGVTERNKWVRISSTFTSSYTYTYNQGGTFQIGGYNGHFLVSLPKVELGTVATSWSPALSDLNILNNIIYDSSGYEHNGEFVGSITINTNTIRYDCCTHFESGQYGIIKKSVQTYLPTSAITVNIWIKPSTWGNPISCTEGGGWNFENSSGIQFPVYISGVGYKVANSGVQTSTLLNDWHMLTGVFNGTEVKIYIDGLLKKTTATGSTNGIGYANNGLIISGEANGGYSTPANSNFVGEESDIRIYATALTDVQILELYNTSATIDKNGNIYAREVIE